MFVLGLSELDIKCRGQVKERQLEVVFPLILLVFTIEALNLLLPGEPGPGGLEGELTRPDHLELALTGVAGAVALGAGGAPELGDQVLDPGVLRMRGDTEEGEQQQGEGGHGQVRGAHTVTVTLIP